MLATDTQRQRLRQLLDARVPDGGLDTDTPFRDAEIDAFLQTADPNNIWAAAASGWEVRAARALSENDGIERFSLDQQSFNFVPAEKVREHALAMRDLYRAKALEAAAEPEAVPAPVLPYAGGCGAPVFGVAGPRLGRRRWDWGTG